MRLFALAALLVAVPAAAKDFAIVLQDQTALRPAARASVRPNAMLGQGETVEVRGERLDYLQVYDYRRERGGYVRASQLRRVRLQPDEAPELLAVLRFLRATPGADALGIAFAAAYIEAAPPEVLNSEAGVEALDALGTLAERLARRKDSAHMDSAARYGVHFVTYQRNGRMQLCYDGGAFRKVIAMPATPQQRGRAALALTRPECLSTDLTPLERRRIDEARAEILDRVDESKLTGFMKNRVLMRRAAVWASLAYQRARAEGDAAHAATRALAALAGINKTELTEEDAPAYSEAALRANASRWAAVAAPEIIDRKAPHIETAAGEAGETCVHLVGNGKTLARRCTYSVVWTASMTMNREGTAFALAVQPTDSWRELWIFRKQAKGWTVRVLPPADSTPDVGYAEFAGWVPGGNRVLVAREALAGGKPVRQFELLALDSLAPIRRSTEPNRLADLRRWQDSSWKRETLSLR
ncbi:MAG TPA: hypothetical protein VEQ87_08710 [Burkholderiales bacterium]|nr:hypothetical protein [Burkholderiales bacterium]